MNFNHTFALNGLPTKLDVIRLLNVLVNLTLSCMRQYIKQVEGNKLTCGYNYIYTEEKSKSTTKP